MADLDLITQTTPDAVYGHFRELHGCWCESRAFIQALEHRTAYRFPSARKVTAALRDLEPSVAKAWRVAANDPSKVRGNLLRWGLLPTVWISLDIPSREYLAFIRAREFPDGSLPDPLDLDSAMDCAARHAENLCRYVVLVQQALMVLAHPVGDFTRVTSALDALNREIRFAWSDVRQRQTTTAGDDAEGVDRG